jgi:hypothetical protein
MVNPGHARHTRHIAVLARACRFDFLRRKSNLFAEGVDTVFGVKSGEADLQAFYFESARFTAAQARQWLAEHGFTPLVFLEAIAADQASKE